MAVLGTMSTAVLLVSAAVQVVVVGIGAGLESMLGRKTLLLRGWRVGRRVGKEVKVLLPAADWPHALAELRARVRAIRADDAMEANDGIVSGPNEIIRRDLDGHFKPVSLCHSPGCSGLSAM